ncbi:hypothetical protein SLA2020_064740 [Shorea laevis]
MEGDLQRSSRDDQMSDYQSFCSNFHPSSQSRKISIGVMVDSCAKRKPGAMNADDGKLATKERINPRNGNSAGEKNKGDAVTITKEKHTEAAEQFNSLWMTTRSFNQNSPASEAAIFQRRSSSLLGTGTVPKKLSGAKDAPATNSVQFFSNQTSKLQDGDGKQKFDGITYKRKGGKNDNSQRVEFTFAAAQQVQFHEPDKVVVEEKTDKTENGKTETLKMKLWEILGTVSSPKNQHSNIQAPEVGTSNLKPEGTTDHTGRTAVKPSQNSDTIEMDIESPENTIKRPVTRSLTRKKPPSKVQPSKIESTQKPAPKEVQPNKPNSRSSSKKEHQESIFCFEGQFAKPDGDVKRGSSIPGRKNIQNNIQNKISSIAPRKINFSKKDNADDIQETTHRSRTPAPPEKTALFGNKTRSFHGYFADGRTNALENVQEKDSLQPPVTNTTNQQVNFHNPALPENIHQQEDFGNPPKKNVVVPKDGCESPTLGIKTPILSTCPSSSPKTVQMEQAVHSPPSSERRFTMGNIRSFKTFQTSRDSSESNDDAEKLADSLPRSWIPTTEKNDAEDELSHSSSEEKDDTEKFIGSSPRNRMPTKEKNDTEDALSEASSDEKDDSERLIDSSPRNPVPTTERNNAEDVLSLSSSEENDSKSSEEGSPIIRSFDYDRKKVSRPETIQVEKPKFMLHPNKRFCNNEGVRANELSPTSASLKGAGENDWFEEPSGQNQDDELARAVTLFALALENFKRKMDSAARKKSSEILTLMSEEIKLRLQNTKSQIESDVEKLTNLSKSKRKRLETRFQEQQEQLKLIHEKFKEDINHHLLDCRSTLEGLEAHQIELKGTLKKQKASHQKLLMQAEEAVKNQLNDAQRQIADVQKASFLFKLI